jgi:hypothetical protein
VAATAGIFKGGSAVVKKAARAAAPKAARALGRIRALTSEKAFQKQYKQLGQTARKGPSSATKVIAEREVTAPRPVKPSEAVDGWNDFLGEGPHTNLHPRTGLPDADRIVSADGTRSIRYGSHEMNSSPTKHHFHQETWSYDAASDTMTVTNTQVRVPSQK